MYPTDHETRRLLVHEHHLQLAQSRFAAPARSQTSDRPRLTRMPRLQLRRRTDAFAMTARPE
jgi:hypothetical protein